MSLKKANKHLIGFIEEIDKAIKKFPGGDERKSSPLYKDLSEMHDGALEMQNALADIMAEVDTASALADRSSDEDHG